MLNIQPTKYASPIGINPTIVISRLSIKPFLSTLKINQTPPPIARVSAEAYRDITGREPVWNGVPGATDGTFLSAWKNIPCLVNGPGPREVPHQADEYIGIDELVESARIYVLSASRFLGSTG